MCSEILSISLSLSLRSSVSHTIPLWFFLTMKYSQYQCLNLICIVRITIPHNYEAAIIWHGIYQQMDALLSWPSTCKKENSSGWKSKALHPAASLCSCCSCEVFERPSECLGPKDWWPNAMHRDFVAFPEWFGICVGNRCMCRCKVCWRKVQPPHDLWHDGLVIERVRRHIRMCCCNAWNSKASQQHEGSYSQAAVI